MMDKPLTGLEKAAALLKGLPTEVVEKALRHMSPEQTKRLTLELDKIGKRPDYKEVLARVLDEAVDALGSGEPRNPMKAAAPSADKAPPPDPHKESAASPGATARVDIRVGNAPEEKAKPPMAPALPPVSDPLPALAALPPDILAQALESENSRTVAALINAMEVEIAGKIFKRLSPAKRKEVSVCFTQQSVVGDDLLRRIAFAVHEKCRRLSETNSASGSEEGGREKRMAGLARNLDRAERVEMLSALEEADSALAGRVKALLYLFEDILRMENSSIQKLLSEIDMKTLAFALRGAAPELQDRITANLSRRAQESLKEEIELAGTVPSAKVRENRQAIEEAIQRLDQRDELVMMESA